MNKLLDLAVSLTQSDTGHLDRKDPSAQKILSSSHPANLLVVPLRTGVLTLAREANSDYSPADLEIAHRIGGAIDEVNELRERLCVLRQENLILEKRLMERKLVERAKGLLQLRFSWTEEEAYYHLRRTSRQQRIPMAAVAQRVMEIHERTPERLTA